MKQTDSITISSPYKSSPEARIKRQDESPTRIVLSEVRLNMDRPCGSLAVRTSDVQSDVIEKPEKPDEHENVSTEKKEQQVKSCETNMDRSNLRDVTPIRRRTDMEEYRRSDKKDLLGEMRKVINANHPTRKARRRKVFQTDENAKYTVQRESDCQGCKFVEFELKILTEKMKELERKVKPRLKIKILGNESFLKKEDLEIRIREFQNEMIVQKSYYQKELEESCNEKERLKMELMKVDEKISILEKETEKVKKSNNQYLSIIQVMRENSAEYFQDQKNLLEMNRLAKAQLYQSNELMAKQYEIMLKKACDDNLKLYIHLKKIEKIFEDENVQMLRSKVFRRQMQKKLNVLLGKFRNEINSSNMKWLGEENIRHAADNFEAIIETILNDKPSFHFLVDRLTIFIKEQILNEHFKLSESGSSKKELIKSQGSEAFVMFKRKFRERICSMLERFAERQKNEFSKNISMVLNHLNDADERIDTSLTNRVENMGDIIAVIDCKQNDLRQIEEILDYNNAMVKTFSDRRNITVEMTSDSLNFDNQKRKLRETCVYLTDGYVKLKKQVENLEKMHKQLLLTSRLRMNQSVSMRVSDDDWNKEVMQKFRPAPSYVGKLSLFFPPTAS
ncbi:unnamed protein product [Cercopithifilaria johnstoni]|uniref:Uncharacterized protein n=1 Tax=Cercopithifilaria johnstoni TaxID=2874296 RepID=A0A8J2LLD9_9BILA|nr:unnamed protein product [Cercopithifilaria johnstoni]